MEYKTRECGNSFKLPETPKLAVDAVIIHGRKDVIVIERMFPPLGWAFPGGFVDVGESCEDAVVRETKEETNLDTGIIRLIGVFSDPKRDPRGHVVSVAYLLKSTGGVPKAKDDAKRIHVMSKNELWPQRFKLIKAHLAILDSFDRLYPSVYC